jgi:hypothetical protein
VNRAPRPGFPSARTEPPWACAISLTSARPRPKRGRAPWSAWWERVKSASAVEGSCAGCSSAIRTGTLADGRGRRECHRGGDPHRRPDHDTVRDAPAGRVGRYRDCRGPRRAPPSVRTGSARRIRRPGRPRTADRSRRALRPAGTRRWGLSDRAQAHGRRSGTRAADGRGERVRGDPASAKDRVLMELAPHLVIDGILLAAHAVGATDAVLCVHEHSSAIPALAVARGRGRHARDPDRRRAAPLRYQRRRPRWSASRRRRRPPAGRIPRPTERGARPSDARRQRRDARPPGAHRPVRRRLVPRGRNRRLAGHHARHGGRRGQRHGVYEIELARPIGTILQAAGGPCLPFRLSSSAAPGAARRP